MQLVTASLEVDRSFLVALFFLQAQILTRHGSQHVRRADLPRGYMQRVLLQRPLQQRHGRLPVAALLLHDSQSLQHQSCWAGVLPGCLYNIFLGLQIISSLAHD